MKRLMLILIVATVAVATLAEPVLAGRRARRRAAVITGVAAGAGAGAAVAATRRTTVVVAPVVVAGRTKASPASVVALPDLTVSDMTVEDHVHCVTIANIGRAAAPASTVLVEFRTVADGALVATTTMRVPPLAVHQSQRFRLHALPVGRLQVTALVDPANRITESDELNNNLVVDVEWLPPMVEPTSLPDVDVDVAPAAPAAEPIPAGHVD